MPTAGRYRVIWEEIERFMASRGRSTEIADLEVVMGMEAKRLRQWCLARTRGGAIAQGASIKKVRKAWYHHFFNEATRKDLDASIARCFEPINSGRTRYGWESGKYSGHWHITATDVPVAGVLEYKIPPKPLSVWVKVTPVSRMGFKAEGHTRGAVSGDPNKLHTIEIHATIIDAMYIRTWYSIAIPDAPVSATGVAMLYNDNIGVGPLSGYYIARPTGHGTQVVFGTMKVTRDDSNSRPACEDDPPDEGN